MIAYDVIIKLLAFLFFNSNKLQCNNTVWQAAKEENNNLIINTAQ